MAADDTYLFFAAPDAIPDSTNPPDFEMRGNHTPVIALDDSIDEAFYFWAVMPGIYDGSSSLTFKIGAVHALDGDTATAAQFELTFARLQDDVDNVETPTFSATAQNVAWTSASANDEIAYDEVTVTNANMDGVQPNEMFVIKVLWDSSEWSNTGDVHFVSLEVME